MTDYEKIYREDEKACGDPFAEYVAFFDGLEGIPEITVWLGFPSICE
jgi:hypothetical protein